MGFSKAALVPRSVLGCGWGRPLAFRDSVVVRNAYVAVTNRVATLKYSGPATLGVRPVGTRLLVTWPLGGNWRLQQTGTLGMAFGDVSGMPVANAALGRMEMLVDHSAGQTFFRLAQ